VQASGALVAVLTEGGMSVIDIGRSMPAAGDHGLRYRAAALDAKAAETWRQPAEAGDPRAMAVLAALLRRRGETVAARHWLGRAAHIGDSEAAFALGMRRSEQGDRVTAKMLWQMAVASGSIHAARALAFLMARSGEDGDATALGHIAAESNHVEAMNLLGTLAIRRGDAAEAEMWHRRAARDGGSIESAYRLGVLLDARGESQEAERVLGWAAEAEHAEAAALLRDLRARDSREPSTGGADEADPVQQEAEASEHPSPSGVTGSVRKPDKMLLRSHEVVRLHLHLLRATGVDNPEVLLDLLRLAPTIDAIASAANGLPEAAETMHQFLRALASGGDAAALTNSIGRLIEGDRDVSGLVEGLTEAERAVLHRALTRIARIDPDGAEPWWEQAAEAGNVDAMLDLGWRLEQTNLDRAIHWYRQAAHEGSTAAMYRRNYSGAMSRPISSLAPRRACCASARSGGETSSSLR
jgi:TPR repeat protein